MRIKGILFDKDGTLIDFFSLWLYAERRVIPEFIRGNNLEEKQNTTEMENVLYESIGIVSDQIDPNGALAYKSYREIAQDMERALERLGIRIETDQIETQIRELFDQATHGEEAKMIPLGDLPELFQFLKKKNLYLGIATADTVSSAKSAMSCSSAVKSSSVIAPSLLTSATWRSFSVRDGGPLYRERRSK